MAATGRRAPGTPWVSRVTDSGAEDVGEHGPTGAADALQEGDLRVGQLVGPGAPGQLLNDLAGLVDRGRPDRVATCLQAAHRRDRQVAVQADPALGGEAPALPALGEAGRLEDQAAHDRE